MYTVLIVEDELLVRLGLKDSIDWNAYNMYVIADVSNGQDALKIYNEERPDIILSDIKMPKMDGIELIRRIRKQDKSTKIVILTCLEEFDLARQAISLQVSDYILKISMTQDEMHKILHKIKVELDENTQNNSRAKRLANNARENHAEQILEFLKHPDFDMPPKADVFAAYFAEQNIIVSLLTIDNMRDVQALYQNSSKESIDENILSIVNSILNQYKRGYILRDLVGRYILLFSFHDVFSAQNIHKTLNQILSHIKRAVKTYCSAEATFFSSKMFNGYENLPGMYRSCMNAQQNRYFSDLAPKNDSHDDLKTVIIDILKSLGSVFDGLDIYVRRKWNEEVRALAGIKEVTRDNIKSHLFYLMHFPIGYRDMIDSLDITNLTVTYINELQTGNTFNEAISIMREYFEELMSNKSFKPILSREVSRATEYIRIHYAENISLNVVSEVVGLTPNYLSSLFKKELDISFTNYVNQLRTEHAKALLINTDLKIYNIRDKVGFSDNSYFSRVFKKHTGLSPNEYKKMTYHSQWVYHD